MLHIYNACKIEYDQIRGAENSLGGQLLMSGSKEVSLEFGTERGERGSKVGVIWV